MYFPKVYILANFNGVIQRDIREDINLPPKKSVKGVSGTKLFAQNKIKK